MKICLTAAAALLIAFGGLLHAQDQDRGEPAGKEAPSQEARRKEPAPQGDAAAPQEIARRIRELGDEDFSVREEAYAALKRIGEPAREALKKALDSEDPEVRWRAARLLCLLDDRAEKSGSEAGSRRIRRWSDSIREGRGFRIPDDVEGLRKHLDALFDELFDVDLEPFDLRFFRDGDLPRLDDLLHDFSSKTGELTIQLEGGTARYRFQREEDGRTSSLTLEIGPDGAVKAETTDTGGEGERETRSFTAPSLQEFKKKYPDLAEKFRVDGFRLHVVAPRLPDADSLGLGFRLDRAPLGFETKLFGRKVLGVYTGAVGALLRSHLGLEEGEGLAVRDVVPGSFADRLGMQPLDIIVELNGETVGDAVAVRRIMSQIEEGAAVSVEILRKGERLRLEGNYSSR